VDADMACNLVRSLDDVASRMLREIINGLHLFRYRRYRFSCVWKFMRAKAKNHARV